MREWKRGRALAAAAAALLLASGLVPARALADRPDPVPVPSATEVPYVARWWDGSRVVSETRTTRDPWYVRGSERTFAGPEAGGGGWHYAGADVRFVDRVDVSGTVDLILRDGVTLTFEDGLHVPPGSTLNVYGQGGGSGTLKALGDTNSVAAIGGNDGEAGGTVNVYGGNVVAEGGTDSAGIGGVELCGGAGIGGGDAGSGGSFAIYGGRVEATGENYGAGIGGGAAGGDAGGAGKAGGTVHVYGGEVVAKGGTDSAGIGGGEGCGGADFEMWGGTVRATGGSSGALAGPDGGAGIGSGGRNGRSIAAGTVRVHGGEVHAKGGPNAAGIGGGNGVGGGDAAIYGGAVEAEGGGVGAGIGGGQKGGCGAVTLAGGTVTAAGGKDAPAVGAGEGGSGGGVVRFEGAVAELRPPAGVPAVRGADVTIRDDASTHLRVVRDGVAVPAAERASALTSGGGQAVRVEPCDHDGVDPVWVWADEYASASVGYPCGKCAYRPSEAAVTTEETGTAGLTRHTARAALDGREVTATATTWNPARANGGYGALVADDSTVRIDGVGYEGRPVDWYVIGYDAGDGTVELLSKQCIGKSSYRRSLYAYSTYDESQIRKHVEGLVADGQPLASARDMLAFVRFREPLLWGYVEVSGPKPYILSKDEAQALSKEKMRGADGGKWFTRTHQSGYNQWCVDGASGSFVTGDVFNYYGVRVAMKLDLERVVFESDAGTFSLRNKRGVALSGGANATPDGETTQQGLYAAMATVTYTANAGYRFAEFEPVTRNGVTMARTADGKVTVSGTPTADVELTVPDAAPLTFHTVTLSGGANATPDGETTQDGVYAAMATVTYTANEGHRFEEFEPVTRDGVTMARTADGKVTVSGTPTADVELTVPDAVPLPRHTVTLSGGANATPDGETTQDGVYAAMATVTYTANEGHRFEEFEPVTRDGVTMARTADGKVTVSGTPTADVELTVPDAVPLPRHTVTLSGGANATPDGETTQDGVYAAMATVTYTANEGHRFEEFEPVTRDGVTVQWVNRKKATVSGTPTADVEVSVPDAVPVAAEEAVPYRAWDGSRVAEVEGGCRDYLLLEGQTTWEDGAWYVAEGVVSINDAVRVQGTANLILCDGASVTANKGIRIDKGALNVYGQSGGTGRLTSTGEGVNPGIGGDGCAVAIHGGEVIATSSASAGVGGSALSNEDGSVTVYGGRVTATGGSGSAGIGGSFLGFGSCAVAVHGGEVTATGGMAAEHVGGAGIGGGAFGQVGSITLSGGSVTAYGSGASAIGTGTIGTSGDVRFDGATVRMYPGTDENGQFRPAVMAASVAIADTPKQELLYRAGEDDALSTAAEAERVSVLTSTGRQYVEAIHAPTYGPGDGPTPTPVEPTPGPVDPVPGPVPVDPVPGPGPVDPVPVPSVTEVPYVARWWDGSQVVSETRTTRDPWYVRGSERTFAGPEAGGGGWHYAGADVRFVDRVDVSGTVDLVLKDGVTLTFEDGLHVPPGSTLNVYGQGGGSGTLKALGNTNSVAAIGGNDGEAGGTVNVYGGRVEATGANYGAGIGGGDADGAGKAGGTVRVYGGEVVAKGGTDSAGIGGGEGCGGADFEMWGGTVNATAGVYGAGIGGGNNGPGGTIWIDGGDVTATGGDGGAGIGGGSGSPGGTITISDGDVTAKGGTYAAGVGGGAKGASGNVTIDGGTVRASCGGLSGAGIGSGAQCDEKDSVNVTINGGLVEATAGKGYEDYDHAAYPGAAIGAGGFDYIFASLVSNDDSLFDGDIRLNGGRITAKAGEAVFARSEGKERDKKRFHEDSNYCNAIGTTDESGLEDAAGTVHFGGAVVHIEPQKDLGGAWSQAVRATSVTFGRKAMDVLYRTDEGGELSLAAEAERVGVLTSAGRQYVQVSPSEEADAGGGEVLPTPEGPLAVSGLGHVQGVGDVAAAAAADGGVLIGTTGQARRLEAISLNLPAESGCHVEYRSHLQGRGWETDWASNGAPSGTFGEARRVEAVQMRLSGGAAEAYSVWYRVHSQTWGWLGWASDGQAAGTAGQAKRAEAVEVCVLPKGQLPEGYVDGQASYVGAARGAAHVQGTGWEALRDSLAFGTTGEARRLEALRLELANQPLPGGIDYAVHVQGAGWLGATDGEVAGTTGESRRVEAVRVTLTGEMAAEYSVWYRVHSQSYGWLGWAHDGEDAGTTGLAKRAEAVEVQVLPAGQVPVDYDASKDAYVVGL